MNMIVFEFLTSHFIATDKLRNLKRTMNRMRVSIFVNIQSIGRILKKIYTLISSARVDEVPPPRP